MNKQEFGILARGIVLLKNRESTENQILFFESAAEPRFQKIILGFIRFSVLSGI